MVFLPYRQYKYVNTAASQVDTCNHHNLYWALTLGASQVDAYNNLDLRWPFILMVLLTIPPV